MIKEVTDIPKEFELLFSKALAMMNNFKFEMYLSWNDERFKNKWDIVNYNTFSSWLGSCDDLGEIAFFPQYLELRTKDDKKIKIDKDTCKKIFLNQGKTTFIQESLF